MDKAPNIPREAATVRSCEVFRVRGTTRLISPARSNIDSVEAPGETDGIAVVSDLDVKDAKELPPAAGLSFKISIPG